MKVIPGEEVALHLQHQLVCNMRFDVPPKHKYTSCLKVWRLKDPQRRNHSQVFNLHVSGFTDVADAVTEGIWNIKTGLLKTTDEVCGTTRSHCWWHETCWWNEHVKELIAAKRQASKARRTGKGTRASYHAVKCIARRAVHHACQKANKVYKNIVIQSSEVYRLANQLRRESANIVGDKPMMNDAGEMSVSKDSKQMAQFKLYQTLLNVELQPLQAMSASNYIVVLYKRFYTDPLLLVIYKCMFTSVESSCSSVLKPFLTSELVHPHYLD